MRFAFATYASRKVVPLGMLSLAAVARAAGHEVAWLEVQSARELVAALRRCRAEAVGLSLTTGMHLVYLGWADEVRRALGLPVVVGGPHATFVPEVVQHPAVDAVCRGEAEETFGPLLAALARGLDDAPLPGVWHKVREGAGARLVQGPLRPPPADLDALPVPAVELVYDRFPARGRYPVKPFLASRGCTFGCAYCANAAVRRLERAAAAAAGAPRPHPVRLRSPELVVAEIRGVARRWPLDLVWLADASLLLRPAWAEELVGRIRRDVGLPYFCKARPDQITEAAADLLARTGCRAVGLGIESGVDRLRTRVLGRPLGRAVIVAACRRLRERGIRVLAFNLVGIPTERLEDALATLDLNVECRVDFAEAMLLQPYPGTALFDWATARGYFDGDVDGLDYSYLSTSPFRFAEPRERDRLERLQRLFGLAVEFPEVRRLLPLLVRLELPRLYDALFQVWYDRAFSARIHGCGRESPGT